MIWLFGAGGLGGVSRAGADPRWLDGAFSIQKDARVRVPGTVPLWNCKSLAACEVPPPDGFRWALYSQDSTSENSQWEMTNIAAAHERACAAVHAHGLRVLTFPANDIVWKTPPVPGRDQYAAFLSRGIVGAAARHADLVGVQSQGLSTDPDRYRRYLSAAAEQAQPARPGIGLLGGLATERLGTEIPAAQMYAAYLATKDICAGYWLNVNHRPERVAEFLALVNSGDS